MNAYTPQKAVLTCRISDARDSNGEIAETGVVDQERHLREHAKRLGWGVLAVVVENDQTAYKRRMVTLPDGSRGLRVVRPVWRQEVMEPLMDGRADGLIALDLDRATRDPRDLEDLIDLVEMSKPRIPVASITGSLDLSNDAGITMARIHCAIANKASRDTARRVAMSRERRALAGQFGGGSRGYGFAKDGVTVREDEAQVLNDVADALLAGVSMRSVLRDLNTRGVPTLGGKPWASRALVGSLLKPRNVGQLVHRGEVVGTYPERALMPIEKWLAVCDLLNDPSRRTTPGNAPRWLGSMIFLCGKCDDGMTCYVSLHKSSSGEKRNCYRCRKVHHLVRTADPVDSFVRDVIVERLSRPDAVDLLIQKPSVDLSRLRTESVSLRARIDALAVDLSISEQTLAKRERALQDRLRAVEGELAQSTAGDPLSGIAGRADARAIWAGLPIGNKRAILKMLCTVTILPGKPGRHATREAIVESVRVDPIEP